MAGDVFFFITTESTVLVKYTVYRGRSFSITISERYCLLN